MRRRMSAERLRQAKSGREQFLALYAIDCILDETASRLGSAAHPGRKATDSFSSD